MLTQTPQSCPRFAGFPITLTALSVVLALAGTVLVHATAHAAATYTETVVVVPNPPPNDNCLDGFDVVCTRTGSGGGGSIKFKAGLLIPETAVAAGALLELKDVNNNPLMIGPVLVTLSVACSTACEIQAIDPAPAGYKWVAHESNAFTRADGQATLHVFPHGPAFDNPMNHPIKIWFSDNADDLYGEPVTDLIKPYVNLDLVPGISLPGLIAVAMLLAALGLWVILRQSAGHAAANA